jgi:hypothetical protein
MPLLTYLDGTEHVLTTAVSPVLRTPADCPLRARKSNSNTLSLASGLLPASACLGIVPVLVHALNQLCTAVIR